MFKGQEQTEQTKYVCILWYIQGREQTLFGAFSSVIANLIPLWNLSLFNNTSTLVFKETRITSGETNVLKSNVKHELARMRVPVL